MPQQRGDGVARKVRLQTPRPQEEPPNRLDRAARGGLRGFFLTGLICLCVILGVGADALAPITGVAPSQSIGGGAWQLARFTFPAHAHLHTLAQMVAAVRLGPGFWLLAVVGGLLSALWAALSTGRSRS